MLRIRLSLGQLESQLDERFRLINVLKLEPSSNDNYDLINQLLKIQKNLNYLQDDIINQSVTDDKVVNSFKSIINRYKTLIEPLEADTLINIDEYKLIEKQLPSDKPVQDPVSPKGGAKSVRFKDDSEEDLRNELMGTRSFKPYRDEEHDNYDQLDTDDASTNSTDNLNNHQLFAKHQQELLNQDEDIDVLHDSVKIQKSMGLNINDEIDNHLIILNDLERGVDNSAINLTHTSNRLTDFRTKVQENGSLVTIVVLTVILIVLLIVLN